VKCLTVWYRLSASSITGNSTNSDITPDRRSYCLGPLRLFSPNEQTRYLDPWNTNEARQPQRRRTASEHVDRPTPVSMLSVLCLRSDRRTTWCILSSSAMRSILGGYEAAAHLIRSTSPSFHSTRHDQREEAAASIGTAYLSQAGQVKISNLLMEERRLLGAQQARARPRQPIWHQHSSLSVCKAAYKRHSRRTWPSMCKSWEENRVGLFIDLPLWARRFTHHGLHRDGVGLARAPRVWARALRSFT
jgi:hypothetical protein